MSSLMLAVSRAGESQRTAIIDAYAQAFGFSAARSSTYIEEVGLANFRVAVSEGNVAAVMAVIRTAHWLGGRPVKAINIAHVAVDPIWRGRGVAGEFLETVCLEETAQGAAMATLFASTRPVYRRAGFALAGFEIVYEAQTSALPRTREGCFRRVSDNGALDEIAPIYRQHCAQDAGLLERALAHWKNLLAGSPAVYVSAIDDASGYLVLDTTDPECLVIRDWVALNGRAAVHLLTLVGTFSSVYPLVRWHGSPHDLLIHALSDKGWKVVQQEEWLARVLDPVTALEQRGYNADGAVGIDLVSKQEIVRLALSVTNGRGTCEPRMDSRATVQMDLADLGTLMTGHRSASFLARAGVVTGDAAAIRVCDALFAGPPPWVGEHF